jgi:hypothetical protein
MDAHTITVNGDNADIEFQVTANDTVLFDSGSTGTGTFDVNVHSTIKSEQQSITFRFDVDASAQCDWDPNTFMDVLSYSSMHFGSTSSNTFRAHNGNLTLTTGSDGVSGSVQIQTPASITSVTNDVRIKTLNFTAELNSNGGINFFNVSAVHTNGGIYLETPHDTAGGSVVVNSKLVMKSGEGTTGIHVIASTITTEASVAWTSGNFIRVEASSMSLNSNTGNTFESVSFTEFLTLNTTSKSITIMAPAELTSTASYVKLDTHAITVNGDNADVEFQVTANDAVLFDSGSTGTGTFFRRECPLDDQI